MLCRVGTSNLKVLFNLFFSSFVAFLILFCINSVIPESMAEDSQLSFDQARNKVFHVRKQVEVIERRLEEIKRREIELSEKLRIADKALRKIQVEYEELKNQKGKEISELGEAQKRLKKNRAILKRVREQNESGARD